MIARGIVSDFKRKIKQRVQEEDIQETDAIYQHIFWQVDPYVYDELLRIIYGSTDNKHLYSSNPPHHLLAFGFTQLLGDLPKTVSDEDSHISLMKLKDTFISRYADKSEVSTEKVKNDYFSQFAESMNEPLGKVIHPESTRIRNTYSDLLDKKTGTTLLEDYYTPYAPPNEQIRYWQRSVIRKTITYIKDNPDSRLRF